VREASTVRDRVDRARRWLRRVGMAATVAGVAAIAAAGLLAAWLLAGPDGWAPGPGPLAMTVALLVAAFGGLVLGLLRWVRTVDDRSVGAAMEAELGWPEGRLRGVLELRDAVPAGTSAALRSLEESRMAERLGGLSPVRATGRAGRGAVRRLRRWLGVAVSLSIVVLGLGLAAPERAGAAWRPLLDPVVHLHRDLPALVVEPGDARVPRGELLPVEILGRGRTRATVRWRATGAVPGFRRVELQDGRGVAALGPVDAPLRYWVETADGARTDTFRVLPVDPLLIRSLAVVVEYPHYLDRPPDRYDTEPPPLRVPAGTRIGIRGRTTRAPGSAALVSGGDTVRLATQEAGFGTSWVPDRSGRYDWVLEDRAGRPPGLVPAPLDITVVPDEAPRVSVVFPGVDTLMPPTMVQPIRADARDDHGIVLAELVSWRVSALGDRGPERVDTIPAGGRERSLLDALLDATERRMLPGDTLRYFVRMTDAAPGPGTGRSRTYALRLPGMAELRERTVEGVDRLTAVADTAAEAAEDLERSIRNLSRNAARAEASRARRGGPRRMGFAEAQQARRVLEQQEALLERVEALSEQTRELERAVEEAGLADPDIQERLRELGTLYEELAGSELRERLEELRRALGSMDPEAVRDALEALAARQGEFRRALEQSLELARRAAAEHQMNALARAVRQTAEQEEALARGMESDTASPAPDRERRAVQQRELADRTGALEEAMARLQGRLDGLGEERTSAALDSARQETGSAEDLMRRAAAELPARAAEAVRTAVRATETLSRSADRLERAREGMASAWRHEVQAAVGQATGDALELARRQEALRQELERARARGASPAAKQKLQGEQAALQQGLEQLGRNLGDAARRSALVGREVSAALGRAMHGLQEVQEGLERSSARDMPADEAARSVDALNRLAHALLRNADRIAASDAGTGMDRVLEQLAEMARQQGELNGRTGALAPMDLGARALARQLRELAAEQRAIGEELGRMDRAGGDDDVAGDLGALAGEAERLAEELDGGRLDPGTLRRQERLFHRLLDAGRSLERDEYSERRTATRPEGVEPAELSGLDPTLLERSVFPPPDPAVLRTLAPAYRALILQYFDRLNRERAGERGGSP